MNKLFAALCIFFSINVYAESLQPVDSKLIADAGIPIYKKATFASGDKVSGFRFATKLPAEDVQKWYQQQLADWSVYNQYDTWVIYDGAPVESIAEVMSANHIGIKHNENLPQRASIDKNMTTEILIMIVR